MKIKIPIKKIIITVIVTLCLSWILSIWYTTSVTKYAERYNGSMFKNFSEITWISDPLEVSDKLREHNVKKGKMDEDGSYPIGGETIGLATFNYDNNKCTIWAYEPKGAETIIDEKYMEILGHEVMHCFRGNFHE